MMKRLFLFAAILSSALYTNHFDTGLNCVKETPLITNKRVLAADHDSGCRLPDEAEPLLLLRDKRDWYLEYAANHGNDPRALRLAGNYQQLIDAFDCEEEEADSAFRNNLLSVTDPTVVYDPRFATVSAAVAYFHACNYELAAELLANSLSSDPTDGGDSYCPFHCGRVLSSGKIKTIADGSSISGSNVFSLESASCLFEKDLAFAIRQFDYFKETSSSHEVRISDYYDFHKGGFNGHGLATIANDAFATWQNEGIIHVYRISFMVDPYLAPDVTKIAPNDANGTCHLRIVNNSGAKRLFAYNKKFAYSYCADPWVGLTDVACLELDAGASADISITVNGTADFYSISYVSGTERYILSGFANDSGTLISKSLRVQHQDDYGDVMLVGKDGGSWLFSFRNSSEETVTFEYNSKMCFFEDAKNWANLYDLKSANVYPGNRLVFRISENYAADYVCFRASGWSEYRHFYANRLSDDCTMDLREATAPIRQFLRLAIRRKYVGSWDIDVTNTYSKHIIVDYNSKMCNDADARSWANLRDVKRINLDSRKTATVRISENWFATTIAFSYVLDGVRLISYANRLGADGSISVFNAVV